MTGGGIPPAFGKLESSRDNGAGCASGLGFGGVLQTNPASKRLLAGGRDPQTPRISGSPLSRPAWEAPNDPPLAPGELMLVLVSGGPRQMSVPPPGRRCRRWVPAVGTASLRPPDPSPLGRAPRRPPQTVLIPRDLPLQAPRGALRDLAPSPGRGALPAAPQTTFSLLIPPPDAAAGLARISGWVYLSATIPERSFPGGSHPRARRAAGWDSGARLQLLGC